MASSRRHDSEALSAFRMLVSGREFVQLARAVVEAERPAADVVWAVQREGSADPTLERIATELERLPVPDLPPQPLQFTIEEQVP